MRYVVDIDGTICTDTSGEYARAAPITSRIQKLNRLLDAGHEVVYFTGRHWDKLELTKAQLSVWGARYTALVLGKVSGDVYLDDRAEDISRFFS